MRCVLSAAVRPSQLHDADRGATLIHGIAHGTDLAGCDGIRPWNFDMPRDAFKMQRDGALKCDGRDGAPRVTGPPQ